MQRFELALQGNERGMDQKQVELRAEDLDYVGPICQSILITLFLAYHVISALPTPILHPNP